MIIIPALLVIIILCLFRPLRSLIGLFLAFIIVAGLLGMYFPKTVSWVSAARAADAYATEERAERDRDFDGVMNIVRMSYYGAACQVLPDEGAAGTAIQPFLLRLAETDRRMRIIDLQAQAKRIAASLEGRALAQTEGCGYWHDHPEAVAALRGLASQ